MSRNKVKWNKSLGFKAIIGLITLTLWLITGVIIVMNTKGQQLILEESERVIKETINASVREIQNRLQEIQALARSEKEISEHLPKQVDAFKTFLPAIINFQGDQGVAGGGFWPEPFMFDAKIDRRSFFWGRDEKGFLKYFDDYNDPKGPGYIHEEWYVPSRYSTKNRCYWSKSYMDPYSYEPMTTCTIGTYESENFSGAVTIDVKLSGLSKFAQELSKKTGGYIFILDRNNRFLTFPIPEIAKRYGKDEKGNKTEEFLISSEFAAKQPLFRNISDQIDKMTQDIIQKAQAMPGYNTKIIKNLRTDSMHTDGSQIEEQESKMVSAMLVDPLKDVLDNSNFYSKFNIPNDFINKQSSVVFMFHVPSAYWKIIVVKPLSEIKQVSKIIITLITIYIVFTILFALIIGYIALSRVLLQPLKKTTATILHLGDLVVEEKFDEVRATQFATTRKDEIGLLIEVFSAFIKKLIQTNDKIQNIAKQEIETKRLENIELQAKILEKEIEATQVVQTSLLPSEIKTEFTNILAYYKAANQAGGDWYGYHYDKNGESVYLYIGDVTGHGVPSSLITGVAFGSIFSIQKLFEAIRENSNSTTPEDFIIHMAKIVNEVILKSGKKSRRLMTMLFLHLNIKTGEVIYVNAGHNPIFLIKHIGREVSIIPNPGNRLGYIDELDVRVKKFTMQPNDSLLLYTDGLIENTGPNSEKDVITNKTLKEILKLDLPIEELKQRLIDKMEKTWQNTPQKDDVTFVIFQLLGYKK